jgi:ubiquinol-cytochrome c reductase cytochrome b subunit
MIVWRQKHAQFPGPRRTEDNVIGSPMFPQYTAKTLALQFGVIAMCCVLGAFVQINPVWLWGPYKPATGLVPAQPDWYIGWLEGALRLGPPWGLHLWGHLIPSQFWPGFLLPFVILGFLLSYPFVEAMLRKDRVAHHLLDRPRDVPLRTAFGVSFLTFMVTLFLAGGDDVQARYLHLPLTDMVWGYRFFCIFGSGVAFWVTYRIADELRRRGGVHEAERLRIKRKAEGGYEEEPVA